MAWLIAKSDFGKIPLTHSWNAVHPQISLHVFCLRIIPWHCKETIANTNSNVEVYRKFFIPRSFLQILLKLQPSDILHVFFTGIIPKYCILAHPVPVRFCIEKIFHSMEIFFAKSPQQSHNYLIKGTKRYTCEAISPYSPLLIVSFPMNIILT